MLAVAPVVTMGRAAMVVAQVNEPDLYWIGFALGGTLSGLGLLLLTFAVWGQAAARFVVAGAVTALIGHNLLPATPLALAGPSLVFIGTGIALAPWRPWAIGTGVVAGLAALLRHSTPALGNVVLALAALGLLVAVVASARSATEFRGAPQHAPTDSNMFIQH